MRHVFSALQLPNQKKSADTKEGGFKFYLLLNPLSPAIDICFSFLHFCRKQNVRQVDWISRHLTLKYHALPRLVTIFNYSTEYYECNFVFPSFHPFCLIFLINLSVGLDSKSKV